MTSTSSSREVDYSNADLWGQNGTEVLPSPNFKDKAFQDKFVYINASVRLAFGLVEMATNAFILHITRKYRSELKTSCYYLLAVNALCDLLVAASTLTTAALTPFGTFQITFGQCFWLNAIPQIAFNMSFVLIFFIAFDRLIAMFLPIWHRTLKIKRYVILLSLLSLLMAIFLFSFAAQIWNGNQNPMLRCTIADFWQSSYQPLLQAFSLSFTIAAILCYSVIWARLKFTKVVNVEVGQDILKSLILLVLIILFSWVAGMAARSLIPRIYPKPIPIGFILMNFTDLTITFNGLANAVVLYFCSKDYRRLMLRELSPNRTQTTQDIRYSIHFLSNIPIVRHRNGGRVFHQQKI